jgi:biopolymer transport protein TolR
MRPPLVSQASLVARINVTPIIDVALVLVIILLITAPVLTVADLDCVLPAAKARDLEEQCYISVTISRDGRVAVDEHTLPTPDRLRRALEDRLVRHGEPDALVVVRADAGLPHATVRHVLEETRAAGAPRVAVATRQKGGADR